MRVLLASICSLSFSFCFSLVVPRTLTSVSAVDVPPTASSVSSQCNVKLCVDKFAQLGGCTGYLANDIDAFSVYLTPSGCGACDGLGALNYLQQVCAAVSTTAPVPSAISPLDCNINLCRQNFIKAGGCPALLTNNYSAVQPFVPSGCSTCGIASEAGTRNACLQALSQPTQSTTNNSSSGSSNVAAALRWIAAAPVSTLMMAGLFVVVLCLGLLQLSGCCLRSTDTKNSFHMPDKIDSQYGYKAFILLCVAIVDLATDVLFAQQLLRVQATYYLAYAVLSLSILTMLINFIVGNAFLKHLLLSSAEFRLWFNHNLAGVTFVRIFSLASPEVFYIFRAGLPLAIFNAPIVNEQMLKLRMCGFTNVIVEDLPQLVILFYSQSLLPADQRWSAVTIVSLLLSMCSCVYSLFSRFGSCQLYAVGKSVQREKEMFESKLEQGEFDSRNGSKRQPISRTAVSDYSTAPAALKGAKLQAIPVVPDHVVISDSQRRAQLFAGACSNPHPPTFAV